MGFNSAFKGLKIMFVFLVEFVFFIDLLAAGMTSFFLSFFFFDERKFISRII